MTMTQFAMVEELASLIKDDLYCKHLVLSIEEALINFIQDGTSLDGILELQPMSSYHRLLLHRLADIFGFAHESVGEGDDRHLVLQRCMDTSIPPILVSDVLWGYGEHQPMTSTNYILRRKEGPAMQMNEALAPSTPLAEREAAYQAARERIFAMHKSDEKNVIIPKSRKVPVVAQRMIAHALGQKIYSTPSTQKFSLDEREENELNEHLSSIQPTEDQLSSTSENYEKLNISLDKKLSLHPKKEYNKPSGRRKSCNGSFSEKKDHFPTDTSLSSKVESISNASDRRVLDSEKLEKQQIGAAKRIFAHALGLPSGKVSAGLPLKSDEGKRDV